MRNDESYVAFVSARWASLYRTSFLLTGDPTQAEDLLQSALLNTYVAWGRVEGVAAPEAYVRKILVNSLFSQLRRRSVNSEFARAEIPEGPTTCAIRWLPPAILRCDAATGSCEVAAHLDRANNTTLPRASWWIN